MPARLACPVGRDTRFSADQSAFHLKAFHARRALLARRI
jgi:hypothetical protein